MTGQLNLKQKQYKKDYNPIDNNCTCSTCKTYTRAYLHGIVTIQSVACHLLTVHNIAFQQRLMKSIRDSINEGRFPEFVKQFVNGLYPHHDYPEWVTTALTSVNIDVKN